MHESSDHNSSSKSTKRLKAFDSSGCLSSLKEFIQQATPMSDNNEESEMTVSGVDMKPVKADDALWSLALLTVAQ